MASLTLYEGRKSAVRLSVLISGGGIGGLSAAFALSKAGHSVTVFDKNPKDYNLQGGGRHLAPNMVKVLLDWGLSDQLEKTAFIACGVDFLRCTHLPYIV